MKEIEGIALAIELCWMTWLIQPERKIMRMEKYSRIFSKI
jgi:hypothetical protein